MTLEVKLNTTCSIVLKTMIPNNTHQILVCGKDNGQRCKRKYLNLKNKIEMPLMMALIHVSSW